MAVDNVVFPNFPLIHGLRRETLIPTMVTVTNGVNEYRLNRSGNFERYHWTWPSSTLEHDEVLTLLKFFKQRNGAHLGFKFQDPSYPNFVNAKLTLDSGSNYILATPFTDDGSDAGEHYIWNFNISDYTINQGTITAAFIDSADGLPKITVSGAGASVLISGPCYFSARFDSDIEHVLVALNQGIDNTPLLDSYNPVSLRELFESADLSVV